MHHLPPLKCLPSTFWGDGNGPNHHHLSLELSLLLPWFQQSSQIDHVAPLLKNPKWLYITQRNSHRPSYVEGSTQPVLNRPPNPAPAPLATSLQPHWLPCHLANISGTSCPASGSSLVSLLPGRLFGLTAKWLAPSPLGFCFPVIFSVRLSLINLKLQPNPLLYANICPTPTPRLYLSP